MRMQQQMGLFAVLGLLLAGVGCGGVEGSTEAESSVLASETETSAQAAVWCQCTNYVNNRFNLGGNFPDAQYWGSYLTNKGYKEVSTPQVGDIVVYSATRMGNCCGHVGVIHGVSSSSLTVRGANQIWSTFTEFNCTNVSQGNFTRSTSGEKYYRK